MKAGGVQCRIKLFFIIWVASSSRGGRRIFSTQGFFSPDGQGKRPNPKDRRIRAEGRFFRQGVRGGPRLPRGTGPGKTRLRPQDQGSVPGRGNVSGYTQGFSPARQGFILFPGIPGATTTESSSSPAPPKKSSSSELNPPPAPSLRAPAWQSGFSRLRWPSVRSGAPLRKPATDYIPHPTLPMPASGWRYPKFARRRTPSA